MKYLKNFAFYLIILFLFTTPSYSQWTKGPDISVARYEANAVLLQDGRVLIAGGYDGKSVLMSCEIYDPLTNKFLTGGDLPQPSVYGATVLLKNGKVLRIGGSSNTSVNGLTLNSTAECYLYDPIKNTWSKTGRMSIDRVRFTASMMPDGKVLVVGGQSGGTQLRSCEIYDPASETWKQAPSIPGAVRNSHSAVVLQNGDVLVTDGYSSVTINCYKFSSKNNIWESGGDLETRGAGDQAMVLLKSGKVLLTGGWAPLVERSELYDPTTNSWKQAASLNTARTVFKTSLLPDGRVLIAGGIGRSNGDASHFATTSCEIYNPYTDMMEIASPLPKPLVGHQMLVLPNGKIFVMGGANLQNTSYFNPTSVSKATYFFDSAKLLSSATPNTSLSGEIRGVNMGNWGILNFENGYNSKRCQIYFPEINNWGNIFETNKARGNAGYLLLPNGNVMLSGGTTSDKEVTPTCEIYNTAKNTWGLAANMNIARTNHSLVTLKDGRIIAIGGSKHDNGKNVAVDTCEVYYPKDDTWKLVAPMPLLTTNPLNSTLLPNGKVLTIESSSGSDIKPLLYDPICDIWTSLQSIPYSPKEPISMNLLADGRVLIVGGEQGRNSFIYDFRANSWNNISNDLCGRYGHTTNLLPNGDVLVIGGKLSIDDQLSNTVLKFNPTDNTFTVVENEKTNVLHSSILMKNSRVLISGVSISNDSRITYNDYNFTDNERGVIKKIFPDRIVTSDSGNIPVTIIGQGFMDTKRGGSEASCGNYTQSATNYPIVKIRRIGQGRFDSDFLQYIPFNTISSQWSDTSTTILLPIGEKYNRILPAGVYALSVVVNGVPSQEDFFSLEYSDPPPQPIEVARSNPNCKTVEYQITTNECFGNPKISLKDLENVESSVEYDPVTKRTIVRISKIDNNKIGTFSINATGDNGLLRNFRDTIQIISSMIELSTYSVVNLDTVTSNSNDYKCDSVMIKNPTNSPLQITKAYFRNNINYLLNTQFPILLKPDQAQFVKFCFVPKANGELRDTLDFEGLECPPIIPVVGNGVILSGIGVEHCGNQIQVKKADSNSFYLKINNVSLPDHQLRVSLTRNVLHKNENLQITLTNTNGVKIDAPVYEVTQKYISGSTALEIGTLKLNMQDFPTGSYLLYIGYGDKKEVIKFER